MLDLDPDVERATGRREDSGRPGHQDRGEQRREDDRQDPPAEPAPETSRGAVRRRHELGTCRRPIRTTSTKTARM